MTEKYQENNPLSIIVNYLEKQNEDALASQVIDVFAKTANGLEQVNLIAKLYHDVRNNEKAKEYAHKVLGMTHEAGEQYNARANLAKLYNNINEPQNALMFNGFNLMMTPNDPDTLMEKVFSLYLLGRKDEAKGILDSLKTREHELEERHRDIVNFNLGTYLLEEGHFIEGMKGFMLKGKKLKLWFSHRELPYKFWDGGEFPGKTLILFAEGGGIGDEMLSVRFMDDLKAIGFRPVFYTSRKDLYNLFNQCGYETVMNLDGIPSDAMWTYFMQVPIYLNSDPAKVVREKYLFPSQEAKDKTAKGRNNCPKGVESWPHLNRLKMCAGEKHPKAKLTAKQVLEIRRRYTDGNVTQTALGFQFGVGQTTIERIVHRKIWNRI